MLNLVDWFYHAKPVMQMGTIVLGLLTFSTILVHSLQQMKPKSDFSELSKRIRSWWLMAGFFFLSLVVHPDATIVLFAVTSFLALKEYFTLIHTRIEDHRVLFWAFLSIPIQYWLVKIQWWALFIIFIPVYMFLFIPARLVMTGKTTGIIESMAKIQWGVMAFVFCVSHIAYLLNLPAISAVPGGGRALVLYLVFLTEINDVAQYTWGKLFGRTVIVPMVSPNKTLAGFLGGIATTVVLAILLRFLSGFDLTLAIASGFLIALSGFIGDVVVSAIKRDMGVKDSGMLIPGHGGMLDRIDSLTYSAPLFFHFVSYLLYPGLH